MPRVRRPTISALVIDSSGRPVQGVPIVAVAETARGERVQLGVLTSDDAGYVSFGSSGLASLEEVERVTIRPVEEESAEVAVPSTEGEGGPVVVVARPRPRPTDAASGSDVEQPAL